MAYSLLRDVNSDTQDWRVRVRIARFWDHVDANRNNEVLRLQFVMVDEKGCAMQGSIAKSHVQRFTGRLVEGHAYYLQYLEVKKARDNYRPVDHDFEAWLTRWTAITEITPIPESLPRYTYKLRSFQSILADVSDKTYLADVAGIVTGISPIVTIDVKGRSTSKRTLRLTDTRDTAMVALWGSNAEALDSQHLIDLSSREPVIALVMGCTHRKQDFMLELSASYGSQVCINADVPDIVSLRDRLVGSAYPIEVIMDKSRRFQPSEIKVATVAELFELNPHLAIGKRFRTKIVIDGVQPNRGWWFLSCDACNCKAFEEGAMYRCSSDKCNSKGASPRYCLSVVASGEGASVEMVFFGDVGRDLVGKPADLLVAENSGFISSVPAEIAALTGRTYVVDVAVSRFSFRADENRFQVIKFYPQGSSVFVGLAGSVNSLAQAPGSALASGEDGVVQVAGGGSGGAEGQTVVSAPVADTGLHTPPPSAAPETPAEKSSVDSDEDEDHGDTDLEEPVGNLADKKDPSSKKRLFPETDTKGGKKTARKAK